MVPATRFARALLPQDMAATICGSPLYMAPEILRHEKYDARIRDEALRAYVAENGLGLVLYLTSFIDRRFVEVEAGIRSEIAAPRRADHVAERMQRAFQRLTPWRRHHRHNDFPSG